MENGLPENYTVVSYSAEYAEAFRALGYAWLDGEYGLIEDEDIATLEDPEGHILAGGGRIYMLLFCGEPCGTVSLINHGGGVYEPAKFTVAAAHRGRGAGRGLMDIALGGARELGAVRLVLYTNTRLKAALRIYETAGFREVPNTCEKFQLSDMEMELLLYK